MGHCVKCGEKTTATSGGVFIQCTVTGNMNFICKYCIPLLPKRKDEIHLRLNFSDKDYSHIEESIIAVFGEEHLERY